VVIEGSEFCFDLVKVPPEHACLFMRNSACRMMLSLVLAFAPLVFAAGKAEHVVLIVWDGMRPDFITEQNTPALHQLAKDGVLFSNHHSVYCTSTEVNGTAIATGAYPEHSGIIANRLYLPAIDPLEPVDTQKPEVVRKGDDVSGGHYLLRPTLAEILRATGKSAVIAGSKQVALLHYRLPRPDEPGGDVTLFAGETLPPSLGARLQQSLGPFPAEVRKSSSRPNEPRDEWTTRALTGPLWSGPIPACSLLWLSEPDFSQHAAGPGSRKALAAIRSSDRKLAAVLAELKRRGLRDKTDVFVVSDHGFSTVERSVDVCQTLAKAGFPAYRQFKSAPKAGDVLVVGAGGSILFYIIGHQAETTRRLVDFLEQQDFAGVLFTKEPMGGAFTLDDAHINSANAPDLVLSMRWSAGEGNADAPGLQISDGNSKPGQGNHGSLSRFDVNNILIGAGPDLKSGYTDTMPSGNTDLAPTILWLLGVNPEASMDGRVLTEALTIDGPLAGQPSTRTLERTCTGEHFVWRQYLQVSRVNQTAYLDEGNGSVERR
jgi:arylsulfatase A-like enzyme